MSALPTHQVDILVRALEEQPQGLTTDVARYFLSLSLAPADIEKMNELAAKARAETLSPDEQQALEEYRRCARVMDLLKLKSRLVLQGS